MPNKSIKIETADRNIFVFQLDEIEKIAKESLAKGDKLGSLNNDGLKSGNKIIVEIGYGLKIGEFGMDRLKVNIIDDYQINPYFAIGAGTGLRHYFDAQAKLIPIFADFRANFINKKVSPYFSASIGYTFDVTNDFEKVGLLFNPTIGVCIKTSDKAALNIGFGYELQNVKVYSYKYNYNYYSYWNESTEISGALCLHIGLIF